MQGHEKLFLHEEIFLLALEDDKGTIASGTTSNFAVGGAIMAELLMSDRVVTIGSEKKPKIELRNASPLGNELLDEWLETIAAREKPRSIQDWVGRMANSKNLKHRVAQLLCRKDILRMDEDKVLLIFNRKIYPEIDPKPERELISRMERAIFGDHREVEPRTAVLVALAHHANILKVVFEKQRLKNRKRRIEQIAAGELTAKATKQAIEAMQAAVMVAVILPAVITTTTVSH